MKKLMLWVLRQSAVRVFGVIFTSIIAILWVPLNKQIHHGWAFVQEAPPIVWGALLLFPTALVAAVLYEAIRYALGSEAFQITPRYARWWYTFPGRRLVLETGSLFAFGKTGNKYCLNNLHCTLKLRWGDPLVVKGAFIENLKTGEREELLFDVRGPSVTAQQLGHIPVGVTVTMHTKQFDLTMEEFIERWGGFRLVLSLEKSSVVRKVEFSTLLAHLAQLWLHCERQHERVRPR